MTESLKYQVTGAVARLTLNRPEALNALDIDLIESLYNRVLEAGSDPAIRVLLLTGEGRGFCAGGDVKNMLQQALTNPDSPPAVLGKRGAGRLHQIIAELRRMAKPVVCAINGPCAGAGVGLALAGDIVWAAECAHFTLAYTAIGLCPDGGTTYALPRAVGEKMAMELFLTNRKLSSAEALSLGLVSRVLPDNELSLAVAELVGRLASGPTLAYAEVKRLVNNSLREGLETQLENETQAVARTITSADFMEGVSAFVQKRGAEFHGR